MDAIGTDIIEREAARLGDNYTNEELVQASLRAITDVSADARREDAARQNSVRTSCTRSRGGQNDAVRWPTARTRVHDRREVGADRPADDDHRLTDVFVASRLRTVASGDGT
jgi:hypothetical protein